MCWVTMGHLKASVGHLIVTVGHPMVTIGHLRLTIGYLKATVVHIRVTLGHLMVTIGYFFSISKHKANTTELHPKVRQTCYQLHGSSHSTDVNKLSSNVSDVDKV